MYKNKRMVFQNVNELISLNGYAKKSMPPPNNRNSDSNDSWIPAQLFGEAGIGQFFTNWNIKKL